MKNQALQNDIETRQVEISTLDGETSDEIAIINKEIHSEESRVDEYRKKIEWVTSAIREERDAHVKRCQELLDKFDRDRRTLTSQLKALSAF